MFLTIPTLMTWTRIMAIPLIVGIFYIDISPASKNLIATVMFVVFAATVSTLLLYIDHRLHRRT